MAAPTQHDEFRFLTADAERVGRDTAPSVARMRAVLHDGRSLSGLRFEPSLPTRVTALHGAGLNAHSFDPALIALGQPAASLDLPGHGQSDWRPAADYTPATIAADIAAALPEFSAEPHLLVGHSLGGLAATLVAHERPDLVAGLVLVDITPGTTPANGSAAVQEFITGVRHYGSIDDIVDRAIAFGIGTDRAALTRGVALNTRVRDDGRYEWIHHFAHLPATSKPEGETLTGSPFAPLWDVLGTLTMPVALIRASNGMVTGDQVDAWQTALPEAPVIDIEGPHNLHEARPVELAAALARLLGD